MYPHSDGHDGDRGSILTNTADRAREPWMTDRSEPNAEAQTQLVEIFVDEELTAQAATRLHLLLTDALDMRPAQLVVDLAGCSYADALAVDVLLNAHRRAWNMGARLTLRSPTPRVQRLLHLAHADHVFNVIPATGPPPATAQIAVSAQGRP